MSTYFLGDYENHEERKNQCFDFLITKWLSASKYFDYRMTPIARRHSLTVALSRIRGTNSENVNFGQKTTKVRFSFVNQAFDERIFGSNVFFDVLMKKANSQYFDH